MRRKGWGLQKELLRLRRQVMRGVPLFAKVRRTIRQLYRAVTSRPLSRFSLEFYAVIILLPALLIAAYTVLTRPNYTLSPAASLLAGTADKQLLKQVSYDSNAKLYTLNKASINSSSDSNLPSMQVGSSTNHSAGFSATLPRNLSDGVTIYDDSAKLSFTMAPQFATAAVKNIGDHFLYPAGQHNQVVYTVKSDGVKEDIILNKLPGKTASFHYQLKLPDYLEARLEKSGAVGIYSASSNLFGNITYDNNTDRAKVEAARKNGTKNNLVFELLPPVINDSNGKLHGAATGAHAIFSLKGDELTVTASGLAKLHYPVSIDPSVLVTSAFNQTGSSDSSVSVTSGQISEGGLSGGNTTGWSYTCNSANNAGTYSCGFTTGREYPSSVAYNGYLYVMGGHYTVNGSASWSSAGTYSWTVPAGVSTISINLYGAVGGIGNSDGGGLGNGGYGGQVTGNISVSAGTNLTMIVGGNGGGASYVTGGGGGYDGGGNGGTSTNGSNGAGGGGGGGCTILENGSTVLAAAPGGGGGGGGGAVGNGGNGGYGGGTTGAGGGNGSGSSTYGTGGGGGTQTAHGNGGNSGGISGLDGPNTGAWGSGSGGGGGGAGGGAGCGYWSGGGGGEAGNDGIHSGGGGGGGGAAYVPSGGNTYANASGSYGSATISYTQDIYLNDVQYAPLNANGTIGSWTSTSSFSTPRFVPQAVAYNGYMYLMGGEDHNTVFGDVQYAKINSNGTLGSWAATTSFNGVRFGFGSVANNGYLYIMGGDNGSALLNDVQYAPIHSDGTIGSWNYTYNSGSTASFAGGFTTARYLFGIAVYNNTIYIAGGYTNGAANDVQFATTNPNGTLNTWYTASYFITARWSFSMTAYDGYLYIAGGYNGSAQVSDVEYAAVYGSGLTGPWNETTYGFTVARWGFGFAAYNGYIYLAGGNSNNANTQDCTSNSTMCNGVQYAQILSPGGVSTWSNNSSSLGTAVRQACSVAYNNYLYVLGGYSDTAGTSQALVQYAALNNDGSTGSWTTTTAFTIGRHAFGCAAYNGYMYITGGTEITANNTSCKNTGIASSVCNDVQYAAIASNGTVGTWTTSTNYFSTPRRQLSSFTYNGYLYIAAGYDGGSNYYNDVQFAQLSSNGSVGTWSATSSITLGRDGQAIYAYNGYAYVLGGNSSTSTGDCTGTGVSCYGVQFAPINANGTLGAWHYTYNSADNGTTYSGGMPAALALFTGGIYNGYIYVAGGVTGSTRQAATYEAVINSNGTIGGWSATTSQATATSEQPASTMIVDGALYTLGGSQGGSAITTVTYTIINNGGPGSLTSGFTASSLPQVLNAGTAAAYNNYIYYLGGHTASSGDSANVYYTTLTSTGYETLGGWNTTSALPQALDSASTVAYDGYLYEMGGQTNGTTVNTTYYAAINSDGTLGTWQTTTALPQLVYSFSAVVYNGYIYAIGGENTVLDSTVYYAKINVDGSIGTWNSTSSLVSPTAISSAVTYNGYIYLVGGYNASGTTASVYFCKINSNGTLTTWSATTGLQVAVDYNMAVAYDGYLYEMGGSNSGGTLQTVQQYAAINSNGTLGNWQATSPLPSGWATAGTIAANGYRCLLGGNYNGAYTSTVHCSRFYSIPRIGRYTLSLDVSQKTNLDITPASVVLNGTNTGNLGMGSTTPGMGGIDVNYALADDSCTTWSVPPAANNALLGIHRNIAYSLNGCNTKTNQARYAWLQIAIDDSQTVTYPDSSSPHSNITGVMLYYHANSGYRLRAGGTFTGQSLQALDTGPNNVGLQSPTYSTINNGLVAYYPFSGNANDQSGNNNNGTVSGATLTTGITGQANSAYSFNGTSSYIQVPDASNLQFNSGSSITLSNWVQLNSLSGFQTFLIKGRYAPATGQTDYALRANGQKLDFYFRNSADTAWDVWTSTANVFAATGTWYQVAITYTYGNASSMTAYVNGSTVAGSWVSGSGADTPYIPTVPLWIGAWNSGEYINGNLTHIRIYNRALSASEVQSLYSGYL